MSLRRCINDHLLTILSIVVPNGAERTAMVGRGPANAGAPESTNPALLQHLVRF